MTHYQELLQLTKLYLLREHSPKEWKVVDEETFEFFKAREKIAPAPPKEVPIIEKEAPSPPKIAMKEPFPEIKKEIPKKEEENEPLSLQPPVQETATNLDDIKQFVEKHIAVLDTPPCDKGAHQQIQSQKNIRDVVILSFDPKPHLFLKNIAMAINQELAPISILSAARIEKEKGWEEFLKTPHIKLIIATDHGLHSLEGLMKYYREVPKQAKTFLANIPLLLLTDLSLYLKQPKLKPALWQAICQMRPWNTKSLPRSS